MLFTRNRVLPAAILLACTVLATASFAGLANAKLAAKSAKNSNPTILPPGSSPHGKTYDQWSVLWWQWFLPLTGAQFADCTIGTATNSVTFLMAGPESCSGTVSPGTTLFFPVANVECSSLEDPPFHGATAAERDTCANGWFQILASDTLSVEIDGKQVQNITAYHAKSADFPFVVGPDNVFGIPCATACSGEATGYGYYLMLAPLPRGQHAIRIVFALAGIDTTWTLNVGK